MRIDPSLLAGPCPAAPPPGPATVVRNIRQIHHRLASAPDLRPGAGIDGLFRRLVHLVVTTPPGAAAAVLADPDVRALHTELVELCARGEYELELAWARRVAASPMPPLALVRFPYLGNYRQLAQLEHEALTVQGGDHRPVRRALFVGAGPLPLSSLLLARRLGVTVDNLDRDAAAVDAARAVAGGLVAHDLAFRHDELAACDDLAPYDLVVLAALVGLTAEQKRRHLAHLLRVMAPGALLLARSAHGLRTLLYPAIELADLAGWDLLAVTHPTGPVINSVILARKP
jgi:nicotianamine synthase